jgi:hypothetical protein
MKSNLDSVFLKLKILMTIGALILISLTPMINAFEINSPIQTNNYIVVTNSDFLGVNFQVSIGDFSISNINQDNENYQKITLANCGFTSDYGKAELPILSYYFAVPQGAEVDVDFVASRPIVLKNYNIYPSQPPKPDTPNFILPPFTKNESFYMQNKFYPEDIVEISSISIMRGCRIARLSIYPFVYNPVKKELKIYSDFDISVSFSGGSEEFITERLRSIYFQPFFDNFLINSDNLEKATLNNPTEQSSRADRADLLIVVYDPFYEEILPLAEWRHQTGIETKVVKWSDIGTTAANLRDYMSTAYNTWELPPSFLLIVGDADHVPVNYLFNHPYHYTPTGTDHWYAAVEGTDYLPEIHAGRISVDNENELIIAVNKILDYSKTPYMDVNWFNSVLLAAQQESGRFFVYTSERIYNYLNPAGYNCNRQYYGTTPPGSTQGVIDAINNGVIIANHRDHGASQNDGYAYTGWSNPRFDTNHIQTLNNGRMYPVMFSLNCDSGWFDGETDSNSGNYESIGEVGLRVENKGFVATIASSRVSYSGYNDEFCCGLFDAIWPDFDPNYPTGGSSNPIASPVYRIAQVMNYGKFWMYDKYIVPGGCSPYPWTPSATVSRATFEMFHVHGDPTMEVWTWQPENMQVTYEILGDSIKVIAQDNRSYIENALVCAYQESGIHVKGLTDDSGEVILPVTNPSDEVVALTVTAHNYLYHQDTFFLNRPPEQPEKPSGEERPKLNTNYDYETNTTDMEGEQIYYKFNWGDGTESSWLGPFESGQKITGSYAWSERGPFTITVKAKDTNGGESVWSEGFNVMVGNTIPSKPRISGPRIFVKTGVEYEYEFTLKDGDLDDMNLYVNFGDEYVIQWSGPYKSGETVVFNHTWQKTKNSYTIYARTKDQFEESDWAVINVRTPRNVIYLFNFFEKILERFPFLSYIFRNLLL